MTRRHRIAVAVWRRQHIRREIAAVLRSSWRDLLKVTQVAR